MIDTIGTRVPDAELARVELLKLGFRKRADGDFEAKAWNGRRCVIEQEDLRAAPLETLMFAREWARSSNDRTDR